MAGMPYLKAIRTISLFGLSDVKLQFSFDFTYEQALQQVLNRLSQLQLPNNAQPQINPISPIGEIYRYRLIGPAGFSVSDLRTLQDWVLQRQFRAIPGVIDVTGWGGKSKTFEVQVDLNKLVAYKLTLPQMLQALNSANLNVGGNTVNIGAQSAVVRGVGQIRSIDDIRDTMLAQSGGSPVFVRDVATVSTGYKPRLGIAGHNADDDIVEGIVLMRRGEESMPTIERVHAAVARINGSSMLPPGVRIERIYDRKDLIDVTTSTVLHNMMVGILLIFILQWLFLGNLRSALIVAATIPFALVLCRHAAGAARRVRQSAVRRRHRLRADRRRHGDHGGGHLPRPGAQRTDHVAAGLATRAHRQAGRDLRGCLQREPLDLLRGCHHHRRLFAAVHAVGSRGPHLQPDGQDLRLCHRRRPHRHLHRLAGAERIPAPRRGRGARDVGGAVPAPALCAGDAAGRQPPRRHACGCGRCHRACLRRRAAAGPGVPAEARGRQPVGARHAAGDHLAGGGQRLRQSHAQGHSELPGGADGGVPAGTPRRRHRRRGLLQRRVLRPARATLGPVRDARQGGAHGAHAGAAASGSFRASSSTSRSICRTTSPRPYRA